MNIRILRAVVIIFLTSAFSVVVQLSLSVEYDQYKTFDCSLYESEAEPSIIGGGAKEAYVTYNEPMRGYAGMPFWYYYWSSSKIPEKQWCVEMAQLQTSASLKGAPQGDGEFYLWKDARLRYESRYTNKVLLVANILITTAAVSSLIYVIIYLAKKRKGVQ